MPASRWSTGIVPQKPVLGVQETLQSRPCTTWQASPTISNITCVKPAGSNWPGEKQSCIHVPKTLRAGQLT